MATPRTSLPFCSGAYENAAAPMGSEPSAPPLGCAPGCERAEVFACMRRSRRRAMARQCQSRARLSQGGARVPQRELRTARDQRTPTVALSVATSCLGSAWPPLQPRLQGLIPAVERAARRDRIVAPPARLKNAPECIARAALPLWGYVWLGCAALWVFWIRNARIEGLRLGRAASPISPNCSAIAHTSDSKPKFFFIILKTVSEKNFGDIFRW